MDDDAWLAEERHLAGPCPTCGAREAMPILYGMPLAEDHERLQGLVSFAGCCLPEVLRRWRCGRCGEQWGTTQLEADVP